VRYVLVGPRELEGGEWRMENGDWRLEIAQQGGEPVFEAGDVSVYEIDGQ
jgi:hypothetical protein